MKWITRFLLILSFLLLGKCGYIYAHAYQDYAALAINPTLPDSQNGYYHLKATEIEEDDLQQAQGKKQLDPAFDLPPCYSFQTLYTHSYGYACHGLSKYYSPALLHRYILYRVFRI